MAAMDILLTMIGDVAAGVAAVAALASLRFAQQTVREARAERVEAERARLVRRVEWVGATIEHIDRLAEDDQHSRPVGEGWRRGCHLPAQGLVGLDSSLPQAAELVNCSDLYSARSFARLAREEVREELQRLALAQAEPRRADRAAATTSPSTWAQLRSRGSLNSPGLQNHPHRLRRGEGD